MDPIGKTLPTLRIQPLTAHQDGGQQQRLPFSFAQGQYLQGVISAKSGANRFTIDIGGSQVLAESTAQLQVGQTLNLQVTVLAPQVELQIVSTNPVNRMIGNTIHLIGHQATTFPGLTDLVEKAGLLPQLSTISKETLQFYANSVANRSPGGPSTAAPQLTVQLLNRAIEVFADPQHPNLATIYEEIGNLLQQLSLLPSLSPDTGSRVSHLADIFSHMAGLQPSSAGMSFLTESETISLPPTEESTSLLSQLSTLSKDNPQLQDLLSRLLPLLQENIDLPTAHPLRQLVSLLTRINNEHVEAPLFQMNGKQLQTIIDRIGIDLEQLLAGGNRERAVQTLKFALLELSQQSPAGDRASPQIEQLAKSIELYQLLQIRLASESLVFLPLPFSFLNQGYLLINGDHGKHDSGEKNGQSEKNAQLFELHLQLEGLGNLQIDIRQLHDRVTLKFLTEDTERAKFLAGFRNELEQWLTTAHLESVQFLVGAKEPVKSLLEKIVSGTTGMVDTKA